MMCVGVLFFLRVVVLPGVGVWSFFCPSWTTTTSSSSWCRGTTKRVVVRRADESWSAELRQAKGGPWLQDPSLGGEARTKNERLLEWLQDEGVWVSEKSGWGVAPHALALATETFDEAENEKSGRGLLARRPITQDQQLIRMPLRLCLTKAKAVDSGVANESDNEYVALAKLLIAEKKKKSTQSFWSSYLDVLPSVADIAPAFAWDDDLRCLEGSPCLKATESMKKKLRDEYLAAFSDDDDDDEEISLSNSSIVSFGDWEWAFAILFSRAIRLSSGSQELLALVPYVDFINHSPFSSSYVGLEDAPPRMPWDPVLEDHVVLYADRSYKKFEQIFISYGPKSNSDLLLLYGFALERNPFNSVNVRFRALPANDPLYDDKKRFVESFGSRIQSAFPLYADRFADEMLQYLRLLVLTENQLRRAGASTLDDLDFSTIVSDDNEHDVLDAIKLACQDALTRYPSSSSTEQSLPAAFQTRNLRMATRLVATEKRILEQTIRAATKKQADLRRPSF
eukprot:CAMPEP_0118908752 /NCGR_PEP_ID=MMETSP1166-20130328/11617_1 /TAXON_ID=1104430 /ORGANISM="Chrysoreinhardia sp, Strain CCMP3193" /LENGTH=509 /DNA_ID=CAMNT_0006848151 /DNA_START=173 /DNA_END=1702 /DNA_ORIENTATION=+